MLSRICRFHAKCTAPQGLWPSFSLKTTQPKPNFEFFCFCLFFFISMPMFSIQEIVVECNLLYWIVDLRSNKYLVFRWCKRRRMCYYCLHPWKAKWPFFIDIFLIFSIHMVFSLLTLHRIVLSALTMWKVLSARHKPGWDNALCCCRLCSTTNLADLSVWYVLFTFKNAYSRISHGFWDLPVLERKYWKLYSLSLTIAQLVQKM